ncbi:two pore domain potassium channel family protein [Candidatus Pacearchaeota archaeon]|nr:two pore domain potassium channel family protein [Candidatus Pacearchaeota archaeon]
MMDKKSAERLEIILAVIIAILFIGSLFFEAYLNLPPMSTSLLLIIFVAIKIHNIIHKKGAVFEDYVSLGLIIVFGIIHFFWGEEFNSFFTIFVAALFLYSIGLIPRLKSIAASKSIITFVLNYLFFVIVLIILFGGFYYSHNNNFNFNGNPTTIDFFDSLYFSMTTFSTIGYGDIAPLGINRLAASIQALFGLTLNIAFIGYILASRRK